MPYNTSAIPPRKAPTGQTQLPCASPEVPALGPRRPAHMSSCLVSRVKKIINQDSDIAMCSNNAAFVITLAAEMFIQHLAEEANTQAKLDRKPRRNIQYKDVANAVSTHDHLEFLEDVVPKTVPYRKAKATALKTHARLRGDLKIPQDRPEPSRQTPTTTNGAASLIVNGGGLSGSAFSVPLRHDDRQSGDDPNKQLEMEMRQVTGRDGDVRMTG
ncbi:Histone-like transcription factor and archaeal histone family protein [Metarhizium album ARSEF 1941]|uniref:Histone-like transcription factor and archaeal histone family protein n=1 Tax=Metarhizium album (strain ARSEF 1941) TaxID=1081103 RepID=A0A0B2WWX6_METAS|nr:Histone-like transcription factor and archaeal histone family protein [Metarhizium album ARSEF 1941]KHN97932.1 Histone-like transcription factor and archaeal histone family protein [Metarhizium album ARSEF 1941]